VDKLDLWLLKRLLSKVVRNQQYRELFSLLYDIDTRYHYEDNHETKVKYWQKFFNEGFVPKYKRVFQFK